MSWSRLLQSRRLVNLDEYPVDAAYILMCVTLKEALDCAARCVHFWIEGAEVGLRLRMFCVRRSLRPDECPRAEEERPLLAASCEPSPGEVQREGTFAPDGVERVWVEYAGAPAWVGVRLFECLRHYARLKGATNHGVLRIRSGGRDMRARVDATSETELWLQFGN